MKVSYYIILYTYIGILIKIKILSLIFSLQQASRDNQHVA